MTRQYGVPRCKRGLRQRSIVCMGNLKHPFGEGLQTGEEVEFWQGAT